MENAMKTYLLNEFNIRSFRGIADIQLHQLSRFNLLVGGNNSGKTSVLEALHCFFFPDQPASWFKIANSRNTTRGFYASTYALTDSLIWLFRHDGSSHDLYQLSLMGEGSYPVRKIEATLQFLQGLPDEESLSDLKQMFSRIGRSPQSNEDFANTEGVELELRSIFEDGTEKSCGKRFWAQLPFVRGVTANTTPIAFVYGHEYRSSELYADKYSQLRSEQQKELLKLVQLFSPQITNISVASKNRRPFLQIEHDTMGVVPLLIFGDGLKRVLYIAAALLSSQSGVLLLDELDGGLHARLMPDVMKWLLKAAREANVQVFATTHSLDMVDALLGASVDRPDELVAYKLGCELQTVRRLSHHLLTGLRINGGLEIR